MSFLLDSVIVIDYLQGSEPAIRWMDSQWMNSQISVITLAEVLAGGTGKERTAALTVFKQFKIIVIDQSIAHLAAALRRQHHWRLPDAMQAAIAQHHGLKLVTRNARDFSPQLHPFVLVPY